MMRRIEKAGTAARSHSDPSLNVGPNVLEVKTGLGKHFITLNSEFRLTVISIPNAAGTSSPAQVEFSGYRQLSGGMYPAKTVIKFVDSRRSAVLQTKDFVVNAALHSPQK
jgi:hypothetical protein